MMEDWDFAMIQVSVLSSPLPPHFFLPLAPPKADRPRQRRTGFDVSERFVQSAGDKDVLKKCLKGDFLKYLSFL